MILTPWTVPILEHVLATALSEWDMFFCDIVAPIQVSTLYGLLGLYRKAGIVPDDPAGAPSVPHYPTLGGAPFTGAATYVISPAAARKPAALIAAHLASGPGQLIGACAVPFLTSVDPVAVLGAAMSRGDQNALSALARFLLRHHFLMDRARALAGRLTEAMASGDDIGPLIEAIHFAFSGQFIAF